MARRRAPALSTSRLAAPLPFAAPVYVTRPVLPPLPSLVRRLEEVWATGQLTNIGAQHERLEAALRAHLGVRELSLFTNGTVALITAIRALGLHGDVLTTPFTFPATPHALSWSGITPVFCDIDPVTLNLDPAAVERAVNDRTTGILAVHVYGNPCDVDGLRGVADRHGLKIIYDAAHAFGTRVRDAGIGTFGDVTMFSFHATKLFHTAEGGALACNDALLKARIDDLRNFGIHGPEAVVAIGLNGKMSELHAALGLSVLDGVAAELAQRARLLARYRERLAGLDGVACLQTPDDVEGSCQYCVIRVDEASFGCSRDALHTALRGYNVFTRKYFYPLCADYDCYRGLPSAAAANLPVAARAVREVLCLPLYGGLGESDVDRICDMVAVIHAGVRRNVAAGAAE
jgi:dTDP-4-amino-4,6-dideoxygalactose transaminase